MLESYIGHKQGASSANVKLCCWRTSACDAYILIVVTVVDAPAQTVALAQLRLVAPAVHVVEQDEPRALSKVRAAAHGHSHPAVQLLAHHVGVHHIPVVIAHCAPVAVVEHLHPALTPVTAVHQLHFAEVSRRDSVRDHQQSHSSLGYCPHCDPLS